MITKLKASPKYQYHLNKHLIHEAEKILKTLR
jgi:hypothetical protein